MANQRTKQSERARAGTKKKLTLSKETLRDLKPGKGIQGGGSLGGGKSRGQTLTCACGTVYGAG